MSKDKQESTRRLSPYRVGFAILILAAISFGLYKNANRIQDTITSETIDPWFAPYVDVTATPRYAFEQKPNSTNHKNLVLSFIVSNPRNVCEPTWGGVYNLDDARGELDLDRRIERYRRDGGNITVSFGGLLNDELAVRCDDHESLVLAYNEVIARYDLDTIDLDLEGDGLRDERAVTRRAKAIKDVQKNAKKEGKNLAVWLTLPVSPFGLTAEGANAVSTMIAEGVDIAGVNIMTMDYGESKDEEMSMQKAAEKALLETHRQLGIIYKQNDISLSDYVLWTKLGVTPMIGQNDVASEVFTIEDAKGLNEYSLSKGVSRISMWSANRDKQCGENYVNTTIVSDSCSGIAQDKFEFTFALSDGAFGNISKSSSVETISTPEITHPVDIPSKSPYQIWNEKGTYLEGTKVVWRQNVYKAKWWTKGDTPDNPVLEYWESPWELVGPVLPGEEPIPQPKLPEDTYPEWSGGVIYDAGDRVVFDEVPYEAKWWTQGDSPAASSSNPDSSPWVPLTREQINEILFEV